jgi:hypothetical protein
MRVRTPPLFLPKLINEVAEILGKTTLATASGARSYLQSHRIELRVVAVCVASDEGFDLVSGRH